MFGNSGWAAPAIQMPANTGAVIMYYSFPAFARMALVRKPEGEARDIPEPRREGGGTAPDPVETMEEAVSPGSRKETQ
jgi:hypothetical protein